MNTQGIVISLCDLTGKFVQPWLDLGYSALLVDPQHEDFGEGNLLKFPGTIEEAFEIISILIATQKVVFVMGFPPCTDVAVSGARWWPDKYFLDPYFQAKASIVAEQCRTIGAMSGAPWCFENPVSAFSNIFGEPSYTFNPYDYSGYCEEDQYFKKTCLWTSNSFVMPPIRPRGSLGKPDERIFLAAPSESRQNDRSKTPLGFSIAVCLYNAPICRRD